MQLSGDEPKTCFISNNEGFGLRMLWTNCMQAQQAIGKDDARQIRRMTLPFYMFNYMSGEFSSWEDFGEFDITSLFTVIGRIKENYHVTVLISSNCPKEGFDDKIC